MILSIIIALSIWFVLPIWLDKKVRKKHNKKALAMLCRIVGAVWLLSTLINHFQLC